MKPRLVRFQGHIRTERYALNHQTEEQLRKSHERYINPQYVVSIDQHTDPAFDKQEMFFISAKHYCKVWTVHGVFEVDGKLDDVADLILFADNGDFL